MPTLLKLFNPVTVDDFFDIFAESWDVFWF